MTTIATSIPAIEPQRVDALLQLLDTPAPSGYEGPAIALWCSLASEFAQVRTDAVGNGHAVVNAGAGPTVLLAGHADEIGFVVTKAEPEGVLRIAGIGGWDASVPVGQRARVLTRGGELRAVVGRAPIHQMTSGSDEGALKLRDLWLDIGASSKREALERVRPGDPVVLEGAPFRIGENLVVSRSADDRLGAFVALEIARRCIGLDVEVVAVATTTEETCQVGAITAAASVQPWRAIVIDVTATSDLPGDNEVDIRMGEGPVVAFGAAARSSVGAQLVQVARKHDIAIQLEACGRQTGTDTDDIAIAGDGVVCGLVMIPTRYMHTPCEMFDLRDVAATVELISCWIVEQCTAPHGSRPGTNRE